MTWSKGEMLKEREPTVMMKKALILLLIFVFCLSSAYAEDNVWVEESWRQIDREVDCDGHPLLIHAKILEIPEKMEACQYFLDNPSYDFLIAKGDEIDWASKRDVDYAFVKKLCDKAYRSVNEDADGRNVPV